MKIFTLISGEEYPISPKNPKLISSFFFKPQGFPIPKFTLNKMLRYCAFFLLFVSFSLYAQAQVDVYNLMERNDLKLEEIETIANAHFEKVGTGKGTGYKQYQRWLFERKFHTDENGNFVPPSVENAAYQKFMGEQKLNKGAVNVWNDLGPTSWNATTGWNPGVGRITSIALHPSENHIIYVSSPGGGIWKTVNAGDSWFPLTDNTNSSYLSVFNLSIDPSNKNTIYACLMNDGVIKSTNGGTSWSQIATGIGTPKKVIVDPRNSDIVLCATTAGIYRSTNGGGSWTKVCSNTMEDLEYNPYNRNIIMASGPAGSSSIWRSSNNGLDWDALTSENGISDLGRTLLAVSKDDAAIVYAVQANGSEFGKMYRSNDSGMTFTTLITGSSLNGTNYFGYESSGTGSGGQATYDMAICANPLDADEVHIAGIICWKSTDGGQSFLAETEWYYPNPTGYNHADVHALEWVNGTLYSGSDGGIYKSVNNGDDWIDLSSGLGIKQIYRISCAKTDVNVITTGAQDNGCAYRQSSGLWKDWLGADGMDNVISPTNSNFAIGTSQNGYIYKTTNGGEFYAPLPRPSAGNWITPLAMESNSANNVYGGWTGIWKSTNGGNSWTNISEGAINQKMNTLSVAASNPNYIYGSVGSTLYVTTNGGANWTSRSLPATINAIAISPLDPSKIWLALNSTSNSVYKSTNAGQNFTNISNGLPSTVARSIVVDDNTLESVYVGMNIGVYYKDNVTPWVSHGTGLPLVAINEVEIQKSGRKLRVATYGRGVWESNLYSSSPCPAPINLTESAITSNEADVTWQSVPGASSYSVDYKLELSSEWISLNPTNNPFITLPNLVSGHDYDWRVRTNCSTGNSEYIYSKITTECDEPTVLVADGIIYNSAAVSWNAVPGADGYEVEYKKSNESIWTAAASVSQPATVLGDLESGNLYDWRVSSRCLQSQSGFVEGDFTTLCVEPVNPSISNVTINSVTLAWSPVVGALDYKVEYKMPDENNWNSQTTSTPVINLSNLERGLYQWRVTTNCTEGSQGYLNSEFVTTCESGAYSQERQHIRYFKLGNIERTSGSDNGYYLNENSSTILVPGENYTISFAAALNMPEKNEQSCTWRFYIDYNRNGLLNDKHEIIGEVTYEDSAIHSFTFTVPDQVALGTTRLRASLKLASVPQPCGVYKYGEVEDYLVDLSIAPKKATPTNLSASIKNLVIYPVPVKNVFNLTYELNKDSKNTNISICDALGKIHYSQSKSLLKGHKNEFIDVSKLINGIYYLTIKTDDGMQVRRFSITK